MRSVVEWSCHTEDLMKVHVQDDVRDDVPVDSQDFQYIRIFLFILITLITLIILITRITRITRDTDIHIKCS